MSVPAALASVRGLVDDYWGIPTSPDEIRFMAGSRVLAFGTTVRYFAALQKSLAVGA
jgi:hypothetical protein